MGISVAIGLAVVSLAAGVDQAKNQRIASRRALGIQKEQGKIESASEKIQLAESRRQQVREARVRKARVLQAAENTGASGSSIASTAISNLSSRVAGNIAFQTGQGEAAEAITNLGVRVAGFQTQAQIAGARSQLGFNVFQQAAGIAASK